MQYTHEGNSKSKSTSKRTSNASFAALNAYLSLCVYILLPVVCVRGSSALSYLSLVPLRYIPQGDGIWDIQPFLFPTCSIRSQFCNQVNSSRSPLFNPFLDGWLSLCGSFTLSVPSTSMIPPTTLVAGSFVRWSVRYRRRSCVASACAVRGVISPLSISWRTLCPSWRARG